MIKTIKVDNNGNNYLINKRTNEILDKYDPSNSDLELVIKLDDDSILRVDSNMITQGYGGIITVQYGNDRFIIDDGYDYVLIKAGYIVFKDYDQTRISDRDTGYSVLGNITSNIENILKTNLYDKFGEEYGAPDFPTIEVENPNVMSIILGNESSDYEYTINFDTVDSIVSKNISRRDNSLSFYPFDKNMDKYGTIYVSIFARKMTKKAKTSTKYNMANSFIKELIQSLGSDYHFAAQSISSRVLFCKGI